MTDVWNLREVRSYRGFKADPIQFTRQFLDGQQFKLKTARQSNLIEGVKKGIHINFQPEISVLIGPGADGSTSVSLHYFAKITVATGVVTGIVTGGLSTIIGVGTFANHVADAKSFTTQFWNTLDGIAVEPGKIGAAFQEAPPYSPEQQRGSPAPHHVVPVSTPPVYASPPQGYYQQPPVQSQQGYTQPPYSQPVQQYAQSPVQQPPQPVYSQPPAQSTPTSPAQDFSSIPTEQLEKLLQYHKDSAWKIESEMNRRRHA
eukprot:TRINITY_DN558_c0_g1_i1.p1 TRINITY_DN558_c0_g1~~TRINITY_DN558_c0_g1_i1.p1  ORF type:complete len:280 (+),score=74.79 TRINITY_DN558_c0_g1_i1:66-842(+)